MADIKKQEETTFRYIRELVESLAVALALAFMFKSFIAEAYVIPTGSMAVTLMGAHKDVSCQQCGFNFAICASEEFQDGTSATTGANVVGGTCPICQYTMYFGDNRRTTPRGAAQPTFTGDRIFVNKVVMNKREPQRWDVTVFRYPGGPSANYIKRLVGRPNERIRIEHGDIFVQKDGDSDFKIARKPERNLLSMLHIVDDTEYMNPAIHKIGWPTRWAAENGWIYAEDLKQYFGKGSDETQWLTYRHIVPSSEEWAALKSGKMPDKRSKNPQLITDFNAYNSGLVRNRRYSFMPEAEELSHSAGGEIRVNRDPNAIGSNWTGDLAFEGFLAAKSDSGVVHFKLIKGDVEFLCSVDLANGSATLLIPEFPDFEPVQAATNMKGTGNWHFRFANVDEQLRFWVDGQEIAFSGSGEYDFLCSGLNAKMPRDRSPSRRDTEPCAIGCFGAKIAVEKLQVKRDIYYIAAKSGDGHSHGDCDLLEPPGLRNEADFARFFSEPRYFDILGRTRSVEFDLESDQFLMLGDNSAKSKDSRLWITDTLPHYVPRNALVGRAIFVYWPHGLLIPGTKLPFVPNFQKMRGIE